MLLFDFMDSYIIYMVFVLGTAFVIYSIFTKTEFINRNKTKIFLVVSILLIWTQIARYIGILFDGKEVTWSVFFLNFRIDAYSIRSYLPFYMCRLSVLVLLYYALTKDKRVEPFLFFWGATGLAGIIYPNGEVYNIVNLKETFFIDHFFLTITPFFLVVYQGYRPSFKDVLTITGLMALILYIFIPLNPLLDADYFYLADQSIFGDLFPGVSSYVFATVHALAAGVFFSVYYLYFRNKEYYVREQ